jgi:hypothetical protein
VNEISQRDARRLLKWAAEASVYMRSYGIGVGIRRQDPRTDEPLKCAPIVDELYAAIMVIRKKDARAKKVKRG